MQLEYVLVQSGQVKGVGRRRSELRTSEGKISSSLCVNSDASSHRNVISSPTSLQTIASILAYSFLSTPSASGLVYDKSSGEGNLLPGIHEHMLYWQDAENKGREGRGKGERIAKYNCD